MTLRIAGAGLAGLLCAHAWPQATVFDPAPGPRAAHRAVLRFRTEGVASLTGIEFRPVQVRKGLWYDGAFTTPDVRLANFYSSKVLGGQVASDRSVWKLDPVQRFIAPETFYEQLVEAVGARIRWGEACNYHGPDAAIVVSTAPMPSLLKLLGIGLEHPEQLFLRQPIKVVRLRVKRCDVFQTVYFPDPEVPVYRASITSDLLIVEGVREIEQTDIAQVCEAFGIGDVELIDSGEQRFGKIVPLPDGLRRATLHRLTTEYGIFSIGRFATWRNVLLDDVVQDIAAVRRLMRAGQYERRMFAAR